MEARIVFNHRWFVLLTPESKKEKEVLIDLQQFNNVEIDPHIRLKLGSLAIPIVKPLPGRWRSTSIPKRALRGRLIHRKKKKSCE